LLSSDCAQQKREGGLPMAATVGVLIVVALITSHVTFWLSCRRHRGSSL
jgi:hypothetical protein